MLDLLQTFVAVGELGNFSAVAKARDLAVSSVSRKIDLLEAELGSKLFRRTPRRVTLTDAGERFLPYARSMLTEFDDAKDALSTLRADPRGRLAVTAPSAFGRRCLAPAVETFLGLYPQIDVSLHVSDRIIDLSVERVDVAIRIGTLPDSDLVSTRLAPLHRIACASPHYLKAHGRPAVPADLVGHNCLTVASRPVPPGWWCFAGVNGGAALAVKGTLRTDDTETLMSAAVAGIGVVHLASWLVSDHLAAGRLVPLFAPVLSHASKSPAGIHAVRMPGRSHAAKAQLFIAHLKTEFGEPPYWDVALRKVLKFV